MVVQSISFLYQFLQIIILFSWTSIQADLSHICAYSNESVVKFRKSIIGTDETYAINNICLDKGKKSKDILHFDWPVDLCDFWISSLFGHRKHKGVTKKHHGIDLAAIKGTRVNASAEGTVIVADMDVAGYGTLVEIQHNKKGYTTRYAHMDQILVRVGDTVLKGEKIGTVGSRGNVRAQKDPSHLHFEIRYNGNSVDPLKHLYCSEILFVD